MEQENPDTHKRIQDSEVDANKRPKTDDQPVDMFATVGEVAEQIDQQEVPEEDDQGIRKTGAMDSEGRPVQEIDSLCMNCHEQGVTRLLMTRIPYFREVIIMSFECAHCGFKNSEIQPASEIQEKGAKYLLKITDKKDMNRQVVKSDSGVCRFVELDVTIPPKRGQLTTVEGLLTQIQEDLQADQPARKDVDPTTYDKIEQFLQKLQKVIDGEMFPFTFSLDDPAGNSWVEFVPGEAPGKWSQVEYFRTIEQTRELGMAVPEEIEERERAAKEALKAHRNPSATEVVENEETEIENLANEVQTFHATCPACHGPCPTHMKIVNIPHFKDVIIMSTVCDNCGYKSNEVKTGGAIPDKGRKITLKIDDADDLARDILKSETCGLVIPELDLDLTPGTLGGRFTTVEGLLSQVCEELKSRVFTETSDSMEPETYNRWESFLARLQSAIDGEIKFTIIMEDPLAASYIQNVYAPDEDPNMIIEDYERTHEQNEDLGLNDMVA